MRSVSILLQRCKRKPWDLHEISLWSAEFSIFQSWNQRRFLNRIENYWIGFFQWKRKPIRQKVSVWILNHFSPFFQIRAKLFWRLVRLNNPHSARGRWKWPSILQWSTSSKEPAGAKPLRREIKVPFLCWTLLYKNSTRSFGPLFTDHRRRWSSTKKYPEKKLRLELNLSPSIC